MNKARKVAFIGLMLAFALVLSLLEQYIPPIVFLPPYFKLGLSNIVVMYLAFFVGKREALEVNLLKSFFVFLTSGVYVSIFSFSGGICSILIISVLLYFFKDSISYIMVSIFSAIGHNLGQFIAAYFMIGGAAIKFYIIPILISGVIMGTVTGIVLKVIMPVLKNSMWYKAH